MTLAALISALVEIAGPGCHAPCKRRAAEVAPVLLAEAHGLDPRLLGMVAFRESSYRQDAVSHKGAIGVMQIHPGPTADAARYCRDLDLEDMRENVRCAVRLLKRAMRVCGCAPWRYLTRYWGGKCGASRYSHYVLASTP